MENLARLSEEASKCVSCGACNAMCPTYSVVRREGTGPRGRVALIRARLEEVAGSIEGSAFGDEYLRDIKDCTLCASCLKACPREVNVPELVLGARAEAARRGGLSIVASVIYKRLLAPGRLATLAMKTASRLKGLLLKDSPVENGLLSRFTLPLIGEGRLVPELADEFFLERPGVRAISLEGSGLEGSGVGGLGAAASDHIGQAGQTGQAGQIGTAKVAFFAGCGINYLMPEVGEATLRVLKAAGAQPLVPSDQVCCGMPAVSAGDLKTAKVLALKNLEAFDHGGFDFITTSCATCTHALKSGFARVLGDEGPRIKKRVEDFSAKVRDITELLQNELSYKGRGAKRQKGEKVGKVVTWHDPCHLSRYQGIREEPRELLKKTGLEFKGMKHPCKCCGLGGGLVFSNYELSMEIAKKKARSIVSSGADVVATACPGCMVQLRDALHRYGPGHAPGPDPNSGPDTGPGPGPKIGKVLKEKSPPKVVHLVELL